MTTVHVFHNAPWYPKNGDENAPALRLVAAVESEDAPEVAANQAIRKTQNIEGSWSLKLGSDGSPDLQVLGHTWGNGQFIGLKSSSSGDVLIVNQRDAYVLAPFTGITKVFDGDTASFVNDASLDGACLTPDQITQALVQAQMPNETPAITNMAHIVASAATIGAMSGIGYSERLRHLTYLDRVGEDHLRLFSQQTLCSAFELQQAVRSLYDNAGKLVDHVSTKPDLASAVTMLEEAASGFMRQGAATDPNYNPAPLPRLVSEVRDLVPELNQTQIYGYFINLDERGEFHADIRDQDDNTMMEVTNRASGDEDCEGEIWLVEAGYMRHGRDIAGLEAYAKQMKIIPDDGQLLTSDEFTERLEERESAPAFRMRMG